MKSYQCPIINKEVHIQEGTEIGELVTDCGYFDPRDSHFCAYSDAPSDCKCGAISPKKRMTVDLAEDFIRMVEEGKLFRK